MKGTVANTLSHLEAYSCVAFLRSRLGANVQVLMIHTASPGHPGSLCRVGQLTCCSGRDETMMLSILRGRDTDLLPCTRLRTSICSLCFLSPCPWIVIFVTICVIGIEIVPIGS